MILTVDSEAELGRCAALAAAAWRDAPIERLVVGLSGDLGAGKTSWVRALLRGLGHTGRVPSPTYTLVERYDLAAVSVVHLDLYRLAAPDELEFLGLRDALALPRVWVFAEWPERGGRWIDALDLLVNIDITGPEARRLRFEARTAVGRAALDAIAAVSFK